MSGGAGAVLIEAVLQRLRSLPGLTGAYDGAPLQAAFPYAEVEAGPQSDWSHKEGMGRALRLAIVIRDKGERPGRLRALIGEAEAALSGLEGVAGGWQLVSLHYLRGRMVQESKGVRAAIIEYRARMLKAQD